MKNTRVELGLWGGQIETLLINRGVLDEHGQLTAGINQSFPQELEDILDGFIEHPIELIGLLKISRDARGGRRLSPAVLVAAHLMAKEVLQALEGADSHA